jgi:oxaloacetate decarboxylase gamma subunit
LIPNIPLFAQASGFDAITQAKGVSIAVTGMLIVFFALMIITLFIRLLPVVLGHFEPYLPRLEPHGQPQTAAERLPVDNEKIVAAIGYVLHTEMEKATQRK